MSIILNHEKLKRFFHSAEKAAFINDWQPAGAIFVKDGNEVVVIVDNDFSDAQFIEILQALVNQHKQQLKKLN